MNVLVVTNHWRPHTHHSPSSGYERLVCYLAEEHDIHLLTWKKRDEHFSDEVCESFPVSRVATPASDIFLERRLFLSWQAMRMAGSYDVVHALYSIPAYFPARHHPTVATVHVLPEIKPGLWMRYHGFIQRQLFKHVAHIITVSTNLHAILADRYGADRVTYIPHGVDVHVFNPGAMDASAVRRSLLGDRFHSLAVVVGAHGLDEHIIGSLAREHSDILFAVINRARPSRLSGERKKIPLELPNVQLLHDLSEEEMITIYEGADLFFRPLQFATANNSVLEAMAMGKPIIVPNLPGVTDYVDPSTAYLAENNEDFLVQFRHAVDHPEERIQKGHRARLRAEQEFAWEHIARKTTAVYEKSSG